MAGQYLFGEGSAVDEDEGYWSSMTSIWACREKAPVVTKMPG
jgi:hypothetical protein